MISSALHIARWAGRHSQIFDRNIWLYCSIHNHLNILNLYIDMSNGWFTGQWNLHINFIQGHLVVMLTVQKIDFIIALSYTLSLSVRCANCGTTRILIIQKNFEIKWDRFFEFLQSSSYFIVFKREKYWKLRENWKWISFMKIFNFAKL